MQLRAVTYYSAFIAMLLLLASCQVTKPTASKASAFKYSRQPHFIKDIYLNGHNKATATANVIQPKKAPQYVPVNGVKEQDIETPILRSPRLVAMASPTNSESPTYMVPPTRPEVKVVFPDHANIDYSEAISRCSGIMGVDCPNMTKPELYGFIDRWYGTNYRLGGEDEEGIDCSGFTRKLYGDVYGVDLTRTADEQYKVCRRVKKIDEAQEGDLVFFRKKSKRITHVGVYLGNNFFVHASSSQGVVISNLKDEYWRKRYAGIGKRPVESEESTSTE